MYQTPDCDMKFSEVRIVIPQREQRTALTEMDWFDIKNIEGLGGVHTATPRSKTVRANPNTFNSVVYQATDVQTARSIRLEKESIGI
jgi:hypothetical protein